MHDQTAALFDRWVRTDAELRMNVDVDAEHWPETEASARPWQTPARGREAEEDCSEDAFSDALTRALRTLHGRFILTRLSDVIFERHKRIAPTRADRTIWTACRRSKNRGNPPWRGPPPPPRKINRASAPPLLSNVKIPTLVVLLLAKLGNSY